MKIALLFGGRGAERAVSCLSAKAVIPRLRALGNEVFPLFVSETGKFFRGEGAEDTEISLTLREGSLFFVWEGGSYTPDLVFPLIHGLDGEDGAWQGLLTLSRTPFVGAGIAASAIGMNKRLAKELVKTRGVPIVPYLTVRDADAATLTRIRHTFDFPLFVKPASGGSSVGVSRVSEEGALGGAIRHALLSCDEVLIERAIDGSELEVAVLEKGGVLLLSPPGEIRTKGGFYDYETKYGDATAAFHLPAPLSLWECAYVKQLAATVFRLIGCRDMARVDFLRGADGSIYFNEINTLPGFTEESLFPRLFSLIGVDPLVFLTEGRS